MGLLFSCNNIYNGLGDGVPNQLHLVCDSCNTVRVELVKSSWAFPSDHSLGDGRQTRSDAQLQLVG